MQLLSICLSLCISQALSAALLDYGAPWTAAAINQYHSQDELGQYYYGYSSPHASKHEARTADGVTHGAYSYVDAHGQHQHVAYKADAAGFQLTANSLKQQPIAETAEVAALRAQHLAAHAEMKLRLAGKSTALNPVQDTPEVAAAKVAFFKRFEAERRRNELVAKSRAQAQQSLYVYQPNNGVIYKLIKAYA
ncbi:Cpr72Eb [Drosophila busckii]|uniref:Cpr72Eb n=1 Tax=Drosophila busckii TaxID=30019 RepID=A0A0M3QWD8_DROBS|nr:Cpr72Eb [Drosophila busckii]